MIRKTLSITAAAAMALVAGGAAHAQDADAPDQGIGAEVSATAQAQDKTDDTKDIGAEVRATAQAQHEADGTDDTDDDGVEAPNHGIGPEVRDMAQDPAREEGIGEDVRELARDRTDETAPEPEPEAGEAPDPRA